MKKSGFTILELLLYLAILSSSILMLSTFINMVNGARSKNFVIAEVEQQGNEISHVIRQSFLASTGINYPSSGSSGDYLSLSFSEAAKNPTIFNVIGGQIMVTEGTNQAISLNNDQVIASGLSFNNLSNAGTDGSVSFQFILSPAATTTLQEFSYQQKFNAAASRRY